MTVKQRTDLEERSDTCELSEQELDLVSGRILGLTGTLRDPLRAGTAQQPGIDTGGSTQGGQNDPAQMFQQIMQQLTFRQ